MAPGRDYAVRPDLARSAGVLPIAPQQNAVEINRSNFAGDDRAQHHRERMRDFSAPSADQSFGAAALYLNRHPGVAFQGAVDHRALAAKGDAR